MNVVLIALPAFIIIFAGWLFKKFGIAKNDWIRTLNQYAYYVALPSFIASSLWGINFSHPESWKIVGTSLALIFTFSILVFAILSLIPLRPALKIVIFLSTTVGNTIYMGAPILTSALGTESQKNGALIGTLFLAIPLIITTFVIKVWKNKKHSIAKQLINFLKNPLMISACIGVFLSFVPNEPELLKLLNKALSMLGTSASPVALFALGGFLHGKLRSARMDAVLIGSASKLIIFPAFTILFLTVIKSDLANIYLLLSAMPIALTSFIIAEEFSLEKEIIASAILVSTIASFFVIPIVLLLL